MKVDRLTVTQCRDGVYAHFWRGERHRSYGRLDHNLNLRRLLLVAQVMARRGEIQVIPDGFFVGWTARSIT